MDKTEIKDKLYQLVNNTITLDKGKSAVIQMDYLVEEVEYECAKGRFAEKFSELEAIDKRAVINDLLSNWTISAESSETLYKKKDPWIRTFWESNPSSRKFWNDYKAYLRHLKKYPLNVIDEIDNSTNDVLDGMGNPYSGEDFEKKGMVIGYVQSGKTGNYIGLISKALDAGYKFIVVLTGMHNSLRQQTQFRIDEGIVGRERVNGIANGVGKGDREFMGLMRRKNNPVLNMPVQTLTTADTNGDFDSSSLSSNGIDFKIEDPLIAVVKKNGSVLKNLVQWIEGELKVQGIEKSNKPVLIIDDECDQASIDNNFNFQEYDNPPLDEEGNPDPESKPSKINELINKLMELFTRRSYVGYTATPYANMLIPVDMQHYKNIFPEDFIVKLNQPSNYMGPSKYWGDDLLEESLPGMVYLLPDDVQLFRENIKEYKAGKVNDIDLPESLKTAVFQFLLSGGIRFWRGNKNDHMSMLIHVSHLTNVQNKIFEKVQEYFESLKSALNLGNDPAMWNCLKELYEGVYTEGIDDNLISQKEISEIYSEHQDLKIFNHDLPDSFADLKDSIKAFIENVKLLVVNSSSQSKLDYHNYKKTGMKVIAIGGNTLSRGLTLEGLHTSYFVREPGAFDTLMQMGRWFGYRDNYADLCRIYTTASTEADFEDIILADQRILQDITTMIRNEVTPRYFQISLRKSTSGKLLTSKMGAAKQKRISWAGGEDITSLISRNPDNVKTNYALVQELMKELNSKYSFEQNDNKIIVKGVDLVDVEDTLRKYVITNTNNGALEMNDLLDFYKKYSLNQIDVVILGRKTGKGDFEVNAAFEGCELGAAQRNTTKGINDSDFFKVIKGKLTDADYLSYFVDESKYSLTARERKQPSVVCDKLDRPVLTFVLLNPYYFYLKNPLEKTEVMEEGKLLKSFFNLGKYGDKVFDSLPLGLSIATPTKNMKNQSLLQEDVYVNSSVN